MRRIQIYFQLSILIENGSFSKLFVARENKQNMDQILEMEINSLVVEDTLGYIATQRDHK